MKNIWQILTIFLAFALLVVLGASLFDQSEVVAVETVSSVSNEDIVIESIMTRTSVRKYTDQQIEPEKIEKILKVGMSAPTAGNRQPWEFYVVTDTTIIKQFTKVTKYTAPMNENALTAIVVCGNPSKSFPGNDQLYWVQDASAATENILLATHAMGLGAVWCGVYPGEDRVATLRGLLDIPQELTPLNIIMMGYPAAEPKIKDKWKPEKIHYVK